MKQCNVQQQNENRREAIRANARAFLRNDPALVWVGDTLAAAQLDAASGILVSASSVPSGGDEESAYVSWLSLDRQFYDIEATISLWSHTLISLDSVANITEQVEVNAHRRGTGKSWGFLALEILAELSMNHDSLKLNDEDD